jgi:hypothetical protein
MRTLKCLLLIGAAAFGLASCSVDQLDTWKDESRVWFTSKTDVMASFKKQPAGTSEITVAIPVSMAGKLANYDREFKVDIVNIDTLNSQTKYKILSSVVRADSSFGVLKVTVYKTANLDVANDTLKFVIRSSEQLVEGVTTNLRCNLIISNKLSKPWWWNDFYCGAYSEDKHQVLFDVFGDDKDIRGAGSDPSTWFGWSKADALYNLYLLNKYCEGQGYTFRFADGQ